MVKPGPPRLVVLTGGVAAGKSAVAERFRRLGVPVIDTDAVARDVVEPGRPGLAAVIEAFGPSVVTDEGCLDRRALRGLVFADEAKRRQLEAILHPRIVRRVRAWLETQDAPYVIVVVPLYVESGAFSDCDGVVVVDVPRALQLERLMARDGMSEESANAMIDAQAGRDARLAVADHVIDNTGSLADLEARVGEVHAALVEAFG